EDQIVLRNEAVFLAVPFRLDIEVASQIREALTFHKEREKLLRFLLEALRRGNVDELKGRKLTEQKPVGTQVPDVSVEIPMLDIDIGERHHRHVIGSGKGYAEGKSLGECDRLAILVGRREYALAEFEPFDQVAPFFFRRLEIAVLGVGKDEIQFVLSTVAEMGLANRFINPAGTKVIYEASTRISLGRGMA